MIFVLIAAAILVGLLMPVQAGLNAELTRFLKHPFLGAFISLCTGSIALLLLMLVQGFPVQEIKRIGEVPPVLFLGGIFGALFVGSSIFFIPRMGATSMIAALITGQLLMSVIMDHYGLLGLPTYPTTLTRIAGVILLFVGVLLVVKKSS